MGWRACSLPEIPPPTSPFPTSTARPSRSPTAAVLGVSTDAPETLAAFAAEHDLDFPLLSDADHAVAEAYGAWVEKNMYGRTHWGVARITFVIDREGAIAHVVARAHPRTHDDKVLAALAAARPAARA